MKAVALVSNLALRLAGELDVLSDLVTGTELAVWSDAEMVLSSGKASAEK